MVLTHKKGRRSKRIAKSVFFERKTGLEPATLTLARLCSTNWATSACLQDRACSGFLLKTMQRYKLFSNPPNLPSGRHGNYIKIAKGLIVVERRRRALQGRYPFIAQGASPGLIIETYLLSPVGAALPRRKVNARVVVPLLRSSYFCVHVYPGFHIGLCPHSTLGYEEVSCLRHSQLA